MQTMKSRTHPQSLADASKPELDIGMMETFAQLAQSHQGHKLRWRNAQQNGNDGQNKACDHIVQKVIAVIAPDRHLPLRMMQGVQSPPRPKSMLRAMDQVMHKVKDDQVQHEADPSNVGHARPNLVEVKSRYTLHAKPAPYLVQAIFQSEKHQQFENPQAVNQGIQNVNPNRLSIAPMLDRPYFFKWRHHNKHEGDLQQSNQQPTRSLIGLLE
jgi:hypothetical protein